MNSCDLGWDFGKRISSAPAVFSPRKRPDPLRPGPWLAACPILSNLVAAQLRQVVPRTSPLGLVIRPEWAVLYEEVFAPRPDVNRLTVEALARVASAKDEILTNYEDAPLMFYTDYRIRGGIPCFRVEDSRRGPPRFLVYRRSVSFVHTAVFKREIMRYRWRQIRTDIPDVPWGNIPEPELRIAMDPSSALPVIFAENLGSAPSNQVPGRGHEEQP